MDTRKSSGRPIPDGYYIVSPDGGGWCAYHFRGGQIIGMAPESDHGTHVASRNHWADVYPREDDELLDVSDEQLSIDIALATGRADAYGVTVTRRARK